MKTRLYFGSLWLKIGISRQLLLKASNIEFEENVSNSSGPDTGSQMDRHDLHITRFLLCEEHQKEAVTFYIKMFDTEWVKNLNFYLFRVG
jgi:hypothetical protein